MALVAGGGVLAKPRSIQPALVWIAHDASFIGNIHTKFGQALPCGF